MHYKILENKFIRVIFTLSLSLVSLSSIAQTNKTDSLVNNRLDSVNFDLNNPYSEVLDTTQKKLQQDSLFYASQQKKPEDKVILMKKPFNPSPKKAMIYSLICPGLGQIYNKKYWKLPIVYGGIMGVAYAISWNGGLYSDYRKAYKDIVLNPQGTTSWHDFVANPNQILDNPSLLQQQTDRLKRRRDYFRRNRDLAIIVGVGLYALCVIDAYVDASLYNFNVSPDLSMNAVPAVWNDNKVSNKPIWGLQCSLTF